MQNHDGSYSKVLNTCDHVFFGIFTISIIVNFLTEFTESGESQPTRSLNKIARKYVYSNFLFDMLAWIPLHYFVSLENKYIRWAFLIKLIRIIDGIKLIDVSKMMKFVQ